MLTKKQISELAQISLGYTFRGPVEEDLLGDFAVIQARNISNDVVFQNSESLTRISLDVVRSNSFVSRGDVLLTSRGATLGGFKATVFDTNADRQVIASSSLYILRLKSNILSPDYLAVYLNSENGQRSLQGIATGATVRSISIAELGLLEIPILSEEEQNTIVALYKNIREQRTLLEKKVKVQGQIINSIINELI